MKKAVLISIRPKWCELIAYREKIIEVRKTRPKLDTPFKVYIYETMGPTENPWVDEDGNMIFQGRGQVVGEFICNRITPLENVSTDRWDLLAGDTHEYHKKLVTYGACLTEEELHQYADGKLCWAWHISDFQIYNWPKKISDFHRICPNDLYCESCAMYNEHTETCGNASLRISRAPQNWCYVEEIP